eukprot:GHVP01009250.1.p2 GENE.GHVP01009250.1~~GHVP01009250.1.p2  ORF type:complete len:158 (+),score=32.45 GHVP01009250.1:16-489(+)
MKLVIQRVLKAAVWFEEKKYSEIGRGLCVLVGIEETDTEEDCIAAIKIIRRAKLFDSDDKGWKKNVFDAGGEVLFISNFTLCGTYNKKCVPDFKVAMKTELARDMYEKLTDMLRVDLGDRVKKGVFGKYTEVELRGYGVATFTYDTKMKLKGDTKNN